MSNSIYSHLLLKEALDSLPASFDCPTIFLPSESSLLSTKFEKFFIESHIFQPAFIHGNFCSLRGQGVELKGDRLITGLGFTLQRVCVVVKQENLYDRGRSVKIVLIDKPLIGDFKVDSVNTKRATLFSGGGPSEWLATAPLIETDFFDSLARMRKTYLLIEGFEQQAAQRIFDLSQQAANGLFRFSPNLAQQSETIETDIERAAYATLHAWVFAHFLEISSRKDDAIKSKMKEMPADDVVLCWLQAPNEMLGKRLGAALSARCAAELEALDGIVSPHQKLSALGRLQSNVSRVIGEVCKLKEVTGEHLVAGFVLLVKNVSIQVYFAHVSHVEMLLSVHSDSLALGQGAYGLSTLQSALDVLVQLKVRTSVTQQGSSRMARLAELKRVDEVSNSGGSSQQVSTVLF